MSGKELSVSPAKLEVMQFLAKDMDSIVEMYLKSIDDNWQPADLLPVSSSDTFTADIKELQKECRELPYDYMVVLIGDIITEEALPSYESWLMDVEGIKIGRAHV